ncbi:hypothetical protein K492DRAFT_174816 [Lichtheimia hyalospora FSU 10163]|nr:hypothetical protein K492DRAFT_174816 [Lichtheimia hyalospora FSU 10163]
MQTWAVNAVDSIMRSSRGYINLLRLVWLLALLYGEIYIFWSAARDCAPWPGKRQPSLQPDKLLLISDTHLKDAYSYNIIPDVFVRVIEFYSDLYQKRNYRYLQQQLDPQATVFLGDLIEGGRQWSDAGFEYHAARFHRLFSSLQPQYHMAGTHDIGFGDGIKSHEVNRFQNEFGPTSYTFQTTHYSAVIVDTLSLSSTLNLSTKNDALSLHLPPQPRILFTHIPLYRRDKPCNDIDLWSSTTNRQDRQHKSSLLSTHEIIQEHNHQYQGMLNEELSQELMDWIQPVAVFSASHHQYCHVKHDDIHEITVPAFNMGVKGGGVVLVDLAENDKVTAKVCWIPDQVGIYIGYGCLLLGTLLALLLYHLVQHKRTMTWPLLTSSRDYEIGYKEHGDMATNAYIRFKRRKWLVDFIRDVLDVGCTTAVIIKKISDTKWGDGVHVVRIGHYV